MLDTKKILSTDRSKILAAIAAVVLGTGVIVTVTSDGCEVTPRGEGTADAGVPDLVEEQGEGEGEGEVSPVLPSTEL